MTGYDPPLGTTVPVLPDPTDATEHWTDIFHKDAAIHVLLLASIAAATFQGYLKDRIPGPVPYLFSDLCFAGAVIIWFGGLAIRHESIRGPGSVPGIVLSLILVPAIYLLHPGTPFLIELAGLRAWSAFPIACLIALTTIRSRGQVRAYVRLIFVLCFVTALYGIWQYRVGPQNALTTALSHIRHGVSIYYTVGLGGQTEFRAFSTFTFPAPFAAMMVFGILLAAGLALSPRPRRAVRVLALALIPVLFVGMTVSGTRAALVILLVGLLIVGRYRGLSLRQLLLVPLLLIALHFATLLTAGHIIARYKTALLHEGVVWRYVVNPIIVAADALRHHPFGLGLGRTGTGVPFQIARSMPSDFFVFSDGDIGRAAVEMGVFGIVLLGVMIVGLLPHAARAIRRLRGTPSEPLALGIGALVLSTGVLILIGSPLSSAPHGTIWWFLLGALLKLEALYDDEEPNLA